MNILMICHRIPYPPNKGDKIRSHHLLRFLSRRHRVWLACLVDDPQDRVHVETLAGRAEAVLFSEIRPGIEKILSLSALATGQAMSVPYFYSRSLQRDIDRLLDRDRIDAVFCCSSPTAEYLFRSRHWGRGLRSAVRIMDLVDMDSLKWRQYAGDRRGPAGWIYRREARFLEAYEKRISLNFDRLLLVSESERRLFLERIPAGNVMAVPNGVDADYFRPDHASPLSKNGSVLVFTGAMDYRPNAEGAIWFARRVFPEIRKVHPDAVFYVVGNRPTPEVRLLETEDGVAVTGFVEDVRDYVALADVCVAPLRIARGIQNKVLEGMAMGKAVATTPEGAEGIRAEAGKELAIVSGEREFAKAVLSLLADPEARARMGANARAAIEARYAWEHHLSILEELFRKP